MKSNLFVLFSTLITAACLNGIVHSAYAAEKVAEEIKIHSPEVQGHPGTLSDYTEYYGAGLGVIWEGTSDILLFLDSKRFTLTKALQTGPKSVGLTFAWARANPANLPLREVTLEFEKPVKPSRIWLNYTFVDKLTPAMVSLKEKTAGKHPPMLRKLLASSGK
ncbi:MAG: hypothetical protein AAB767_00395 [Patescibacteria group bacterium]